MSGRYTPAQLEAAAAILIEEGFAGLRPDRIAAHTGDDPAVLAADWDGPHDLVLELVGSLRPDAPVIAPTGTLETRLWGLISAAAVRLDRPQSSQVAVILIAEARTDGRLAEGLRRLIVEPRRQAVRAVLEEGVASGELRPDLDLDLATDTLVGPVYYRVIVTGAPVGRDEVRQVVNLVLSGARDTRRVR